MKRIRQWRRVSGNWAEEEKETELKGRMDAVTAMLKSWTQHYSEEEKREGTRAEEEGAMEKQQCKIPPQPDLIHATWSIRSLDLEKCQIKASKPLKDPRQRQGGHEDATDRCIHFRGHFRKSRRRQSDIKISNMTWWVSRRDGRKY